MLARVGGCPGSASEVFWARCWTTLFSPHHNNISTHLTFSPSHTYLPQHYSIKAYSTSRPSSKAKKSLKTPSKTKTGSKPKKPAATTTITPKVPTISTTPKQPKAEGIQFEEEGEILLRYRPDPSNPPKRVAFSHFLARAKENKITIADITAEVPKKELQEMLKSLYRKTNLKDLTIRAKEITPAQASLISKVLQTCTSLHTLRIFSADFQGPKGVNTLSGLTTGILNSENLESISLETCKISPNSWAPVAEWLRKSTKLKFVDFKRTLLTNVSVQQLLDAIKENESINLNTLDLRQNMISDEGVATVLKELTPIESIKNVSVKTYEVFRHNWNHTQIEVDGKIQDREDAIRAEIEKYRHTLKDKFVPKPLSTIHSNENEYIDPKNRMRLKQLDKENKIMKAYEDFDYLKDATNREILKKIKLMKKRVQSKRGAVVKLK